MTPGVVRLKAGKERKVRNFYPWIQRGECRGEGVQDGTVADLVDGEGGFLARGTYNSKSRFLFRVLSLERRPIDEPFFHERFCQALALRQSLGFGPEGRRLVYSEADQLPGLIIDQFGPHLVVQVRSLGMELLRPAWLPALIAAAQPESVYEKSEMAGRGEEGLEPVARQLHGTTPDPAETVEDGLWFPVPIAGGLKTGFYLDQRETRRRFEKRVQSGDRVLDCFCYSGGFSFRAARAGAEVIGVDIHEGALESAREAAKENGLTVELVQANAFEFLGSEKGGTYDWIVLDPPAIAKTSDRRDSLKWALWKLVNLALPQLRPGGRLIVCSCSYQMNLKELVEICRLAASDRGCRLFLEDVTYQDLDHPAPVHFPEALYLKCAWLRLG